MAAKLNGWVLSLILHGMVGALAAWSVFGVASSGGSGSGSAGGAAGGGGSNESYEARLHSEELVSGEPVADPAQYGRLTEDVPEPTTAEAEIPPLIPFDVFAVGASDPPSSAIPPSIADPLTSRPAPAADRVAKLPEGSDRQGPGTENDSPEGNSEFGGTDGPGGSGGGDSGGDGKGQGTGVGAGNATEVYTPTPAYPSDARRRNIQGIVLVEIAITSDGSCNFQRILESSGCESLDDAVAKTVTRWKYRSAAADGRPDVIAKRVRFVFRLSDKDR
jgi:TonB family protein